MNKNLRSFITTAPYALLTIICCILFVSCRTSRKITFAELNSLKILNGTYINEGDSLAQSLGLGWKDIDLITLNFESDEILNISYPMDTDTVRLKYKGKFKNNYFESYLEKTRLITLIFNQIITDKLRIGRNTNDDFFIYRKYDGFGSFLIIMGVNSSEYTYTSNACDKQKIYPFKANDKWGYKNYNTDSIVIEPVYDLVKRFDRNIGRAKLNGKWQLINIKGQPLTSLKYDNIEPFRYDSIAIAYIGNKKGMLNRNGIEIVPVIYDELGNLYQSSIARSRLGDKYGYISSSGVLYPPVFDKASDGFHTGTYCCEGKEMYIGTVKIGEDSYKVDSEGYAYKYKNVLLVLNQEILYDTKKKVSDLLEEKGIIITE